MVAPLWCDVGCGSRTVVVINAAANPARRPCRVRSSRFKLDFTSQGFRNVNSGQISSQLLILGSKKGIQTQCCLESGQHFLQLWVTRENKHTTFSGFEDCNWVEERTPIKLFRIEHSSLFQCFPNIHVPILNWSEAIFSESFTPGSFCWFHWSSL